LDIKNSVKPIECGPAPRISSHEEILKPLKQVQTMLEQEISPIVHVQTPIVSETFQMDLFNLTLSKYIKTIELPIDGAFLIDENFGLISRFVHDDD
jgi:hypothetical protein